MGATASKAVEEQAIVVTDYRKVGELPSDGALDVTPSPSQTDQTAKAVGLENYGNTCYCNSVIQLLYSCRALRQRLLVISEKVQETRQGPDDTVLMRFCELVAAIQKSKKKRKDPIGPNLFVQKIKKENIMFRNAMQQDAHEFAMFLMNCLIEGERSLQGVPSDQKTPIEQIFEGTFASETSCMECETKTVRYEPFLDLSVEIEPNVSLARCIETFSAPEFLIGGDKFRCDACSASTPARRSLRLQTCPSDALLIHLKRFKYQDDRQVFRKLSSYIPIPNELAVQASQGRFIFVLKGFVLHHGSGPNLGHYIACVRSQDTHWKRFDDDIVTDIHERDVQQYFGVPFSADSANTSTAYILLYERLH